MNFSLYIARRYLFSTSNNNTINIITAIATLGVIIGTMALFIVLSGFSGLKTFSLNFLNTSDPDLKISTKEGKSFLFTKDVKSKIEQIEEIAHYTKVVEERVFLEHKNKTHLGIIKGIEKDYTLVNNIDSTLIAGYWINFDFENQVIIGRKMSDRLSMGINDYLEPLKIYVPKPGKGYISSSTSEISKALTQSVGIYSLTEDIDDKYVFGTLPMSQELLGYLPNQISAIEIKVQSLDDQNNVINQLEKSLGTSFKIQTREQLNAIFYKMLNTENLASYLISTLILIIALFNVIGALIMMIFDKKKNLKTLSDLGASIKEIRRVFILQGFLLTLLGLSIGLVLAIILILIQINFGIFMITSRLAFPVEFRFSNLLIVITTILTLGYLASLIASSRISNKTLNE